MVVLLASIPCLAEQSVPDSSAPASQPTTAAAATVFVEKDGCLVMEAESASASHVWKLETANAGYTGKGYYVWRGEVSETPGADVLTYRFRITRPGTYRFFIRGFIEPHKGNDVWAKFDGEKWIKMTCGLPTDSVSWGWGGNWCGGYNNAPRQFELSAGYHTLSIAPREQGYCLDRIVLFIDESHSSGWNPATPESSSEAAASPAMTPVEPPPPPRTPNKSPKED
jgi:hypothetical protein